MNEPLSSMTPALERRRWVRLHIANGWLGLFVFTCLGLGLEFLHAWKVDQYLNVEQETRRLLWRLAHAHGTLLSLVQLAFAWTLTQMPEATPVRPIRLASQSLSVAALLLPCGFFLGGLGAQQGDPGPGVVLVPLGALSLLIALGVTAFFLARAARKRDQKG